MVAYVKSTAGIQAQGLVLSIGNIYYDSVIFLDETKDVLLHNIGHKQMSPTYISPILPTDAILHPLGNI